MCTVGQMFGKKACVLQAFQELGVLFYWKVHLFEIVMIFRVLFHNAFAFREVFDEPDKEGSNINFIGKHFISSVLPFLL